MSFRDRSAYRFDLLSFDVVGSRAGGRRIGRRAGRDLGLVDRPIVGP